MLKNFIKTWILLIPVWLILFSFPALGAEISVPAIETNSGATVEIPVMADNIADMAGLKMTIVYDTILLAFKEAKKSEQTSPLMHIVNNKRPGRIVLVMAGATGVSVKDGPLVQLVFDVKKDIPVSQTVSLELQDVQLMSGDLKDIPNSISVKPLTILPVASSPVAVPPESSGTTAPASK